MNKLFKRRAWLTLPEVAKHLSGVFVEEVTEEFILRSALDGQICLSIRFVNDVPAMSGTVGASEKSIELETLTRYMKESEGNPFDERVTYSTSIRLDSGFNDEDVNYFNDQKFTTLSEVFDLPMIGDEKWEIERRYQLLSGGPGKSGLGHEYGSFVRGDDGNVFRLLNEQHQPLYGLPADGVLVVRAQALSAFEELMEDTPVVTEKPLATTERNSLLTIIAALCKKSAIKYQERGAAKQIAKITEEIGASVSDDTVGRVLDKIPDALEARMK